MKTTLKIALTLAGVVVLSKVVLKRKLSHDSITQSQLEKVKIVREDGRMKRVCD